MPTVLVNPNSGQAEAIDDPSQVNQLLASGYHVPLHDSQGNAFSAPYDQAAQLVSSGQYRTPTPDELSNWMDASKYSSPEQQAGATIEGAARGIFSAPITTAVETHLLGISPEDQLKRKNYNPGMALAGEMGGTALAAMAGGGLFGDGAAALAEHSLPGIISKASDAASDAIKMTGGFGTLARAATQGAVQAGLYQAQNEISEAMLGDPNATAEHMIANIGLSTALGAGFGVALKPVTNSMAKVLNKTADFINEGQLASFTGPSLDEFENLPKPNDPLFYKKLIQTAPSLAAKVPVEELPFEEKADMLKTFARLFTAKATLGASEIGGLASKFVKNYLGDKIGSFVQTAPEMAPLMSAMLGVHKIGVGALQTIENNAAGLFGYGSYEAQKVFSNQNEMHPLYEQLRELGPDPGSIINHVGRHTGVMANALPNTTKGIASVLTNAAGTLNASMPNLAKAAPLDAEKEPTTSDKAKFNQIANIADQPLSLMDHLKDGTLTTGHMAVANSLYPHVVKSIQKSVLDNLMQYQGEKKPPLSSKMRLGLSTLFGQNMDSSLSGLLKNQLTLAGINQSKQAAQTAQSGALKSSKTGIGKMKIATADETKAQQALNRKAQS